MIFCEYLLFDIIKTKRLCSFKPDMAILPKNLLFQCKIHPKMTSVTYFRKFSWHGHQAFNFLAYVIMIMMY